MARFRPINASGLTLVVALVVLTGCGSTVQLQGLSSQGTAGELSGLGSTDSSHAGASEATPTGSLATAPDTSAATPTPGGGSGEAGSGDTSTTSGSQSSARNLSNTTPIQIGILAGKAVGPAFAAIGGSGGPTVDNTEAVRYFVATLNAQGGLAGRKIVPIYSFIDPTSTDYETQAQSACANFTQDHHVAAAMAFEANYYSPTFTACMQKANIPNIAELIGGIDDVELANNSTLFSPLAPTVNRRFTALIKGLTGNGFLTKKNKIGVILEDCPQNVRAYGKTVGPLLKTTGITIVKRVVNCATGFGDAAAIIAAFGNAVLPFKAAGVDRVMFVSGFEQLGAGTFEKQAKSQSYAPSYALTSTSSVGVNDMSMPAASLSRVENVGWSSVRDVNTLQNDSAAQQRCRKLWKPYSPANERVNRKDVELVCEGFFELESGLKRSGGNSVPAALISALDSLATTYVSPTNLGGATLISRTRRDSPRFFAISVYKQSCSCFVYSTKPSALA